MRIAGLDEAQAGMKTAWRNTNNLRYAGDTTLMKAKRNCKSLLLRVKEESDKARLKFSIQKTEITHLIPSFHGV